MIWFGTVLIQWLHHIQNPITNLRKKSEQFTQLICNRIIVSDTVIMVMYSQCLTHWGRDKMVNISQTTFPNVFSSMKMFEFQLKFHWSLFLRVQLKKFQHCFRWWLGAGQATSHYLKQCWLVYWCVNASLSLNELKCLMRTLERNIVLIITAPPKEVGGGGLGLREGGYSGFFSSIHPFIYGWNGYWNITSGRYGISVASVSTTFPLSVSVSLYIFMLWKSNYVWPLGIVIACVCVCVSITCLSSR